MFVQKFLQFLILGKFTSIFNNEWLYKAKNKTKLFLQAKFSTKDKSSLFLPHNSAYASNLCLKPTGYRTIVASNHEEKGAPKTHFARTNDWVRIRVKNSGIQLKSSPDELSQIFAANVIGIF